MLKNYLLVALRALHRKKGYTVVNVLGLTLGVAASLLIFQYVSYELSYDVFHEDGNRIYRLQHDRLRDGELLTQTATTFSGVAPALQAAFPEVEAVARITRRYGGGVVRYEDHAFREEQVFHADPTVLTLFSYPLLQGDRATALLEPNTAVISTEAARKYFGDQNPLGETVIFGSDEAYTITGVAESLSTSHFQFDFLFSYHTLAQMWDMELSTSWASLDFLTYVKLRPDADPSVLEAALPAFVDQHQPAASGTQMALSLQPLRDIYLHSDLLFEVGPTGSADTVYILGFIALFILVIAWVNYINLSTARAMERAREIGVRKVVGARKTQLIGQFLLESLLLNLIAGVLAVTLVQGGLPLFNQLTGAQLQLDLVRDVGFWLAFISVFGLGALLAGLYPAFVLSSFRPMLVLKGTFARARQGLMLRKGLVVFQFVATVVLIAGTLVVYEQITFMQHQDLGIDIEQTLVIDAPGVLHNNAAYTRQFESFKQALLQHPQVRHLAVSSEIPGAQTYWVNQALRLGASREEAVPLYIVAVDYDYLEGYDHELVAGRFLSRDFPADAQGIVLNEQATAMLGWDHAEASLGQRVRIAGDSLTVVGIVADHHQQGLQEAQYQIAFRLYPEEYRYFSVKMGTDDLTGTMQHIEQTYAAFFPGSPFTHTFLNEVFDQQYQTYRQFGQIVGLFAVLAILVACLGLFGLSTFSASQRTKEIGIRKVLGSSIASILVLLSNYYVRLVLLGSVIAIPLAWFAMGQWLGDFAYRVSLSFFPFAGAILLTLVIALLSVSYQTLKAALANPVDALRYE